MRSPSRHPHAPPSCSTAQFFLAHQRGPGVCALTFESFCQDKDETGSDETGSDATDSATSEDEEEDEMSVSPVKSKSHRRHSRRRAVEEDEEEKEEESEEEGSEEEGDDDESDDGVYSQKEPKKKCMRIVRGPWVFFCPFTPPPTGSVKEPGGAKSLRAQA